MFMKHYAPNRCEPSIEVIMKMGVQWGIGFFLGASGWMCRVGGGGGQGGCERRIKVFVKIPPKKFGSGGEGGGGGGGVRVDVNGEVTFL